MQTHAPASRHDLVIGLFLVAAMWPTRSHDFTFIALPDVTWAAFFLAGMFSRRWLMPAALMLNAFLIDYVALLNGVSDYCVTPAYAFLVPTHLWLWAAGRWAQQRHYGVIAELSRFVSALSAGILGAFFISNASFYAFAGYFGEMSALEYASRVARYLPQFFEGTAIYAGIGLLVGLMLRWIPNLRQQKIGDQNQSTRG